jgi:hypothetical protein
MKYYQLSSAFGKIGKELELPEYLKEICSHIASGNISREKVDEILINHHIHYSIAKVEFLKLIFEYIKRALEDNILTCQEKEDIKFLKGWFRIRQGDFYYHNKEDIEQVITYHLSKIYQDNFVTDEEALLKVDLQEIFDLSFDQMNNYSKIQAHCCPEFATQDFLVVYKSVVTDLQQQYFYLK